MTDRDRLTEHVLQGLTRPQKALSSAWFYDDEGSRLFQQIMALPEYYPHALSTSCCAHARMSFPGG